MNDKELIKELQKGSDSAFKRLLDQHRHRVVNICYRFTADRDDAQDVAQETFVEVYHSLPGFRGDSSLSTWIYRIAVAKSLDFLRRKSRKKRKGLFGGTVSLDDHQMAIPAPESSNPEMQLQDKERLVILQAALDSLPDKQRIAFVLGEYDGLSYVEIAAVMKTTVPAVESLIYRARKNLQKKLNKYYSSRILG
jgi:RNA polymerase sigma-70 factor, ECF subfamily